MPPLQDATPASVSANNVDKILNGGKLADLLVEQPKKLEKTAKQIGLTIPPNVLARADRIIK